MGESRGAHARFLDSSRDDDLGRLVEFVVPRGGESASCRSASCCSTPRTTVVHHRGQVALLIQLLGYTPGNVDMLIYDAAKRRAARD